MGSKPTGTTYSFSYSQLNDAITRNAIVADMRSVGSKQAMDDGFFGKLWFRFLLAVAAPCSRE